MKRAILILAIVAVVSFGVYSVASAFFFPKLVLEKERALGNWESIEAKAEAEGNAFFLGDPISYSIEVKYNPGRVEEIDRTSLDKNVILEPFQIRGVEEKEFLLSSELKVYQRIYEIQLIDGRTNERYDFPTITLRYKLRGFGDFAWFDEKIEPRSIFISSRFPQDVKGYGLKSLEGKVKNINYELIPRALWSFGFLCLAFGIGRVVERVLKQKKERKDWRRKLEGWEDLFDIYQKIKERAPTEDPRLLLHGIYQFLRELLDRKELSLDLSQPVSDLKRICQNAYRVEPVGEREVEEALRKLEEIVNFYLGKSNEGEVK